MERTEFRDMMGELKPYRMESDYDETLATAMKHKHEPQHTYWAIYSKPKYREGTRVQSISAHNHQVAARQRRRPLRVQGTRRFASDARTAREE